MRIRFKTVNNRPIEQEGNEFVLRASEDVQFSSNVFTLVQTGVEIIAEKDVLVVIRMRDALQVKYGFTVVQPFMQAKKGKALSVQIMLYKFPRSLEEQVLDIPRSSEAILFDLMHPLVHVGTEIARLSFVENVDVMPEQ